MADVPKLKMLSDSAFDFADPAEDVRGRTVLDAAGEEVGEVRDLVVDPESAMVRFLRIGAGGFFGIGEETFLVPVDAVKGIGPDTVSIDRGRERMRDAPRYQPELATGPDYYEGLYGWWGYAPYWVGGYVPGAWPYPPR
jgi:sporulation protein YlmC with PRC-barrel domain